LINVKADDACEANPAHSVSARTIAAAILNTEPLLENVEVAVAYVRGEGDTVGRTGRAMSGKFVQLYAILTAGERYGNNRR
jgi:hypothetical protein